MVEAEAGSIPDAPVAVVGAGMAGLVCAVALHEAGLPVRVYEAGDAVGGRVRSDRDARGYVLDRGFQVLLDAYPAVRRWVDVDALAAKPFTAGAQVWTGQRLVPLANPFVHPSAFARDVSAPVFGFADKLRLARFGAASWRAPWRSANDASRSVPDGTSAAEVLWGEGFDRDFVERFAEPFWGGILLDPTLRSDAGPLLFTLKMFLAGRAVLPAAGIGAMPEQLAGRLPAGAVRLRSPVSEVLVASGQATGVRVGGKARPAAAVVVAVDPPSLAHLRGVPPAEAAPPGVGSLTVFLHGGHDPGIGSALILDGTRKLTVNHVAPLSAVQPAYAPPGRHLLAAVVVGEAMTAGDDATLGRRARDEVAAMLGHPPEEWDILRAVRVPYSQFAQPPGSLRQRPENRTEVANLFIAGELTVDSSYNGAMQSGAMAADLVRHALAADGPSTADRS